MTRREGGTYPLSKAQERMWFLNSLNEGEAIYNNPAALRIRGEFPLNIETLRKSLASVMARHEILRTTFLTEQGLPYQKVHNEGCAEIEFLDLREMPSADKETFAADEALNHGRTCIDLERLPLLRFKVLRLDETEYLLLINPHHIISDGWSNALFAKELSMTYAAMESNEPLPFPTPEYQYIDFVKWEKDWMNSQACSDQLAFWIDQLKDLPEPLKLPLDFPRPPTMTYRGAREFLSLSPHDAEQLRQYCQKNNLTMFHLLFGSFAMLMSNYSGQDDLVVGMPVARRNQLWFQNTMGLFINTLPLRVKIDRGLKTADFLQRIRESSQQALLRQELPFEKLVEVLNPDRDLSTNPVFQVHFVYQNIPSLYSVKGLTVKPETIDYSYSKFDLNFWVEEAGQELILSATYPADIFRKETIAGMIRNYRILLFSILAHHDSFCGGLEFFEAAEKSASIAETDKTHPEITANPWLSAFHDQVRRTPHLPAVRDLSGVLSYEALDRESEELAVKLREAGAGPGDRIGIMLPRNSDLIKALLAVFKCGAAYVPLDLSTPAQRLDYIRNDASLKLIIGQDGFSVLPDQGPVGTQDPELAYVIYTSGTTGLPKGVCVGARQLFNYSVAVWKRMGLGPGDSCATVTSFAADLGNTSIFPPLIHGGSVVVVPEEYCTDATLFAEWMSREPVSMIKIVPAHLLGLLDSSKAAGILPLKLLVLGGDRCTPSVAARVRSLSPALRIINHYGPTEATVGSLTWELPQGAEPAVPEQQETYPVGFPLDNTSVYICNRQGRILPKGIPGEIVLGGGNIAGGYLNQPGLSSEKFRENPYSHNGRIYLTGDKGVMHADGSVVFLGRMDQQVKVRGYRVEPREIEQVLSSHPEVERAVVIVPDGQTSVNSLKAVVLSARGSIFDKAEVLSWLEQRLPAYMIPSDLIQVDAIPVTPNGKTDLAKLRALASGGVEPKTTATAPRDLIELKLLQLYEELLNSRQAGIDDSFFELGGNSLLAIRLFAGIERVFGIHLPLATLFTHPSVKALSRLIRDRNAGDEPGSLVSIRQGKGKKKLYMVHPAGGNVLCYYELSSELADEFSVFGLQASGLHGRNLVTVSDMASAYLETIDTEGPSDQIILGGWSMGAFIAFEMARQLREKGISTRLLIIDQLAPRENQQEDIPDIDPADRMMVFAGKVAHLVGRPLGIDEKELRGRSDEGRSELFLDAFKKVNLVPDDMKISGFHGYLETMIRHNEITSVCRPGIYDGPALLIRAEQDLILPGQDTAPSRSEDLGWKRYIPHGLAIRNLPGNHVSIMARPWVKGIADALSEWTGIIAETDK
jgi:amino acid adenylation domain-containing protein